MKDFFKDMLIEPFEYRDWGNYVLGGIMWLVTLSVATLFIWFSVWLVDSSFLPIKEKEGIVIDKYYVHSYYSTTYVMTNNMMMPITTYYPEQYKICVKIDGLTDNVSLRHSYWDNVFIGQKLCCKYTNGRILNSMYVDSFCDK